MSEAVTLTTILDYITQLVTAAVGWVGQFIGVITDNPLLLMFCILSVVGLGVGLLARLIRL